VVLDLRGVASANVSYQLMHGEFDAPLLIIVDQFELDIFSWVFRLTPKLQDCDQLASLDDRDG
jgi:hypothetical protein